MKFNRRWLPLNALRAFEATAKHFSFTLAADELGVTQSAVSRQVGRLEDLLGVKLIERKPREISLTSQGKTLVQRITESFDAVERTLREVVEEDNRETLRMSIATSFAHCVGPQMVAGFVKQYPWIELEIDSQGDLGDLNNTDYDIAIIFSKPKITSQVMDLLWMEQLTPLCAPDLVPDPVVDFKAFMKDKTFLHVKVDNGRYYAWETWAKAAGMDVLNTHHGIALDASMLAVRYAVEGQGVVMADKRLFCQEIEDGRLCAPIDVDCESGYGYYMIFRQDDLTNERLQLFRNWVIEYFTNNNKTDHGKAMAEIEPG